ncbi:hypothetical protein PILCRDRAFT_16420 [Piloderma croceum F 1598]|uniref:Uncharacterized protein n=1 Tax=Piloderma croceum (strain F 1598) TaxID=765440 RepID=A0A0C3EVY8_PILCF|nr:hypothetical protein PILCRDRAFT_16420 [Piloderma croceum F 1598]
MPSDVLHQFYHVWYPTAAVASKIEQVAPTICDPDILTSCKMRIPLSHQLTNPHLIHSTPKPMHMPSQGLSTSAHDDNDENYMGFDFDVPQSPFRDDTDDTRLGGDNSTSTPTSSQGRTFSTSHSNMRDEVHPPVVTRTYHPDINGRICDQHGNNIPSNTPPPLRPSEQEPDDWALYNDHVKFEVTNFLISAESNVSR